MGTQPFERLLMEAIRHNNLKPPDTPFDIERYDRASQFAERVMCVVQPYCEKPGHAAMALVAAGYVANIRFSVDEEVEHVPGQTPPET